MPSLPSLSVHTAALLAALDEEIRLLELRRSQLEALAAALVGRDDAGMETLLGEIQQTLARQADVDARLKAAQADLGDDLQCPPAQRRLRALAERLHGRQRAEIESRRQRIIDLAEGVRRQHLQTSILLMECARINRLLLEGLFPQSRGLDTYSGDGSERWWPRTGLVNAER